VEQITAQLKESTARYTLPNTVVPPQEDNSGVDKKAEDEDDVETERGG
jgi:hypothetical protein